MATERISLKIAGKRELARLYLALSMLVLLSVLFSPQPGALIVLLLSVGALAWLSGIFRAGARKSENNETELILVIFSNGQIRLSSGNNKSRINGVLHGQQWCTRLGGVLRIKAGSEIRYLVVLSYGQSADEFRRLNVWLRQGITYLSNGEGRVKS